MRIFKIFFPGVISFMEPNDSGLSLNSFFIDKDNILKITETIEENMFYDLISYLKNDKPVYKHIDNDYIVDGIVYNDCGVFDSFVGTIKNKYGTIFAQEVDKKRLERRLKI